MNTGWRGLALVLLFASSALGIEPEGADLVALNARIGSDYEALVPYEDLVLAALDRRLVLYGEVHDQEEASRHFLRLVERLRQRSEVPMRIGIEFLDRGDSDVLVRYLERTLDEHGLLERIMPTSMLLWPEMRSSHLEVLRYARRHGIDVVPLESRPSGARPMVLRNSEIRWNLARHLGRHANERLIVLYGVEHVLGSDRVTLGLEISHVAVTSYADSVTETFLRREGRYPAAGELLRIRSEVYLQAVGGAPRRSGSLGLELGDRESLLQAIEASYLGNWSGLDFLVQALTDPEVRWRRAAFHALRFAAERSFGYDPEAGEAARHEAQKRWAAWWNGQAGEQPRQFGNSR